MSRPGPARGLKFVESTHRYTLDGRSVPGVTGILGSGLPKPGLPYWAAKSVAEWVYDNPDEVAGIGQMSRWDAVKKLKSVPWEARDVAAARGTEVHALGEAVVHGQDVEVPEHLVGHVQGYADLIDEIGLVPVLTERRVLSRTNFYAGTFDLLADVGGERLMLDLKTSKAIYGSVACQVAAYANADAYLDDDANETPLPHIDGLGAIHVTAHGSALIRFPDPEMAWKLFQHIAWVARQIPVMDGWGGSALNLTPKDAA